jgi:hypothetical protein
MPLWAVVRRPNTGTIRGLAGLNMANRSDSEVHQHETLPGPGPGAKALPPGVRPVEQMVDAAIERIAREHGLSRIDTFDSSIATPMSHSDRERRTRLNWKGLDVSDEFRAYAERVARGEDLPPFEGRVLAEPNPAFPWGPGAPAASASKRESRTGRAALWTSAVAVLGLLGWSVALKIEASSVARDELAAAAARAELLGAEAVDPEPVAAVNEPDQAVAVAAPELALDVVAEPTPLPIEPVIEPSVVTPASAEAAVGSPEPVAPVLAPNTPPFLHAAVAPAPTVEASAESSVSPAAAVVSAPASAGLAPVKPASPAPVAAVAPSAPAPLPAPVDRAVPAKPQVDEFGILVDSPSSASVQAKSVMGSVGDLARAGQGAAGNVRKEPGGESSAKGLLVETPSF